MARVVSLLGLAYTGQPATGISELGTAEGAIIARTCAGQTEDRNRTTGLLCALHQPNPDVELAKATGEGRDNLGAWEF